VKNDVLSIIIRLSAFSIAHRDYRRTTSRLARATWQAAGLSLPTIQRMETSEGVIRGNVDSLMKLVAALNGMGIELIADNATSQGGGRGVRLKAPAS